MINVLTKNIPWRFLERSSYWSSLKEPIRVTFWFDGSQYHPLVETLDSWQRPTSGFLLAANAKLIQAVRRAEEWVSLNCEDTRLPFQGVDMVSVQ